MSSELNSTSDDSISPGLSLLMELPDQPGSLERALQIFSINGINLTHIESRPAAGGGFDFYVDCEGERGNSSVEKMISALTSTARKLLVLDHRRVPWYPRHIAELEQIATQTLDAGVDLQADHPGFKDAAYRIRRAQIDQLARRYHHLDPVPQVNYTREEHSTWKQVYERLNVIHDQYACFEYLDILARLEKTGKFNKSHIPQGSDVSHFLREHSGFRLWPVPGLLSPRNFLNGLAFRVFFSTQYIRHHSKPMYTPEPDVCHELLGHAPMLADPAFADLSQEIGLASLGASDVEIERLARCYWHSVEFGLVKGNGGVRAYGAGLLSSFGELEYACGAGSAAGSNRASPIFRPWNPAHASEQTYPITEYQPLYFVADSLQDAKQQIREHCRTLSRPFFARYNPATERIWVDRAVHRINR